MAVESFGYAFNVLDNVTSQHTRQLSPDVPRTFKHAGVRAPADIIDIRRDVAETSLREEIMSMLSSGSAPKQMPTLLLYDEAGLQLFEEITYLQEYYLTNAEISVLSKHAHEMAEKIPSNSMVVELGSGNLRKVSILLNALDAAGKYVDYYALDLNLKELERTLAAVPIFKHVTCHGLLGTYDDGLEWLQRPENEERSKCIMTLGSSIGNFHRPGAAKFLKNFAKILGPNDRMLVGLDGCEDPAKVYHAYNDSEGTTHRFVLNGLQHANELLGTTAFNLRDWRVVGKYVYDGEGGRHEAFYVPSCDVTIGDVHISAGEEVKVEQSLKYSHQAARKLWNDAGLAEILKWTAEEEPNYGIQLLKRQQTVSFPKLARSYAATTVPSLQDFRQLWTVWDTVTRSMLPDEELQQKPIKLRNACIFYLGHIPTFLDIQVSKASGHPLCKPSYYCQIFERGIDPDVDDPEQCHDHSEVPDEWPPLNEILEYQNRVRVKLEGFYATREFERCRKLGRAMWIGFEHEAMHLETLLYMLLQSENTLPPPAIPKPDFEAESREADVAQVSNEWFTIPERTVTIGMNDPDDNSGPDAHFGWDNEKPQREARVGSFMAKGRPITNEEYATYLSQTNQSEIPASWSQAEPTSKSAGNDSKHDYIEGKYVRTFFGPVPLKFALHWPAFASYDELAGCARWMGGRIPTADETHSIYEHAAYLKRKTLQMEQQLDKLVPAVNGHLVNNGVQETPPETELPTGEGSSKLFADLDAANVAFANWRQIPVTADGHRLCGRGEMGGVWEWTSSPLTRHDGFEPMSMYPGYTADFFDGKHHIILGGSWATHPRIAGRKSFVNWYQHNYPFPWAGARLVKDL